MSPKLPDWFAESERPLEDYLDEFGEFPDEATMKAVFEAEAALDPGFWHRRVVFPLGQVVYTSGGPARGMYAHPSTSHVYPIQPDGTASRKEAAEYVRCVVDRGDFDGLYETPDESEEFWRSPTILYHGTRHLREVLRSGLVPHRETHRGVTTAVFTSPNVEVAAEYAYGDDAAVLRIDTEAMKRDGVTPPIGPEPQISDRDMESAVANRLGMEDYEPEDDAYMAGVEPETVLIYEAIAPRYLRVVKDDSGKRMRRITNPSLPSRRRYLFHVTLARSLDDIADSGLVAGGGCGLGEQYRAHCRRGVFLADGRGVLFWMSKAEELAHRSSEEPLTEGWVPVVLRAPRPARLVVDEHGTRDAAAPAWIAKPIRASKLEVWDGARWRRLVDGPSLDLERAFDVEPDPDDLSRALQWFRAASPFMPPSEELADPGPPPAPARRKGRSKR